VVAADQRMVIRCLGDDLPGFVHDVFHVTPPSNARRYRPSIGSSDAAEQWHAGLKLYVGSDQQQIAGTLCTMPCVSAVPLAAPAFMLSLKWKSGRRRGSRPDRRRCQSR
jgi:hypothetical protein